MSLRLGRIMGIPVRIHYTLWLVFILIAWSLAYGYMPHQYPGLSVLTYWAIGIASAVILFASVLIHELSHSYIAKKNGLPIARITLFFFGGVSEMTEEPQNAGLEVRMAAAGPLMSFLIAGVLGALWYLTELVKAPVPIVATLGYGALINAALGLFNLVPAFPLDGGRVFRGSLWKRSGNLIGATSTATRVSEALSLLMMFGGFVAIIFGDFVDGIWIVVLGWFIRSGAETSLRQTLVGEALTGVAAGSIMTRNVLAVPPDITVQQSISNYFLVHPHGGYPVLRDGRIIGLITLRCVRSVPAELRETRTVEQAMVPYEQTIMIGPSMSALDAMQLMARKRVGRLLIAENGQLLGIMTRGDLMKAIQTRQELHLGSTQRSERGVSAAQPAALGQVRYCVQCGGQLPAGTAICPHCNAKQPQ
jgi:Zn-dependent protease/predicted transcriptional regulator